VLYVVSRDYCGALAFLSDRTPGHGVSGGESGASPHRGPAGMPSHAPPGTESAVMGSRSRTVPELRTKAFEFFVCAVQLVAFVSTPVLSIAGRVLRFCVSIYLGVALSAFLPAFFREAVI